jgi:predicted phage-related endonuclease
VERISVEALSEDLATLDEMVVGNYPVLECRHAHAAL